MSQPASLHGLAITFLCSKLLYFSLFGLFVLQAHELVLTIISLSIYLYVNICKKLMGSCCSSISSQDPQRFLLSFPFFIFVNISSSSEKPDSSLITYFFNQFTFGFKVTHLPIIVASVAPLSPHVAFSPESSGVLGLTQLQASVPLPPRPLATMLGRKRKMWLRGKWEGKGRWKGKEKFLIWVKK